MNPPPFAWEAWYQAVGGRSIQIDQVERYLRLIREEQEPHFTGPVADQRHEFPSPDDASAHLKQSARKFGADLVGICEIEPSDVYRGRTVTDRFAVAVAQRMRWRGRCWRRFIRWRPPAFSSPRRSSMRLRDGSGGIC